MELLLQYGLPLFSIIISACSIYHAHQANKKSEEANKLSSKSIAINYDATFNDFNIQLKENELDFIKLKDKFKNIKSQNNKEYMYRSINWLTEDLKAIQSQRKYMRPSEYYNHYEELEYLGEEIKINFEIMKKIAETFEGEAFSKNENYTDKYNDTLKVFDLIIKRLETKIAK